MKPPTLPRWAPVRVEWVDSGGCKDSWVDEELTDDLTEIGGCVTIGMIQSQRPDRLTLVLSHDTHGACVDGVITIPAVAITSVERLGAIASVAGTSRIPGHGS